MGQPIIAGDGYAYIPYVYALEPLAMNTATCTSGVSEVYTFHTEVHSRLLRVGTDGSATKIVVGDWTQDRARVTTFGPGCWGYGCTSEGSSGAVPNANSVLGTLITNADQGVLYSWTLGFGGADSTNQLTPVTAGTAGTTVALAVPGSVQPVLQGQNGNFLGATYTQQGSLLVSFDLAGNVQWSVPGFSPVIATADGGVIAQSADGLTNATFDQNGNATGQLGNLPTQSWTGNSYLGSVERVAVASIDVATSFWPFQGANASTTASATQQPWYAPLQSCPGAKTPCAQEAIMSALGALRALLTQQSCTGCVINVFNHLPGTSQSGLAEYLSRESRLFDGTRSYAHVNVAFCPSGFFNQLSCRFGSETVRDYMKRSGDAADSQTPSDTGKGMQIFFDPAQGICNVLSSPNPKPEDQGVLNQATLFHEALHGYTGDVDVTLQSSFGLPLFPEGPTINITYYLESKVIPGGAQGAAKCGN